MRHPSQPTPIHFRGVNPIKDYRFGILGSRAIDWYMYGSDPRRGGGLSGGENGLLKNLGHPLQNFSGPLLHTSKGTIGFLSSRTVNWHPLWTGRQVVDLQASCGYLEGQHGEYADGWGIEKGADWCPFRPGR
eukprot:594914-Pelagomonas_calceolata.AAC.1